MINRILIRLKVVQLLYSYLLTRTNFSILPPPESESRDKRFAYGLYCDLLLLLLDVTDYKISNYDGRPRILPSMNGGAGDWSRVAATLASTDEMRDIAQRHRSFTKALQPIRLGLIAAMKDADIYKKFVAKRKKPEIEDEVKLWHTLFNTVLLPDKKLQEIIHANPDFTIVGYDEALRMLGSTLDDYSSTRSSLVHAHRDLGVALDKSYELYHSLLQLMIDLTRMRDLQLDEARHKYLPTHDDLNPSTRFVDNKFIKALASNPDMQAYLADHPISWLDDDVTVRRLLDKIMSSDTYKTYMTGPEPSFVADAELWLALMKNEILESDYLAEALESQSVYWNDDVNIMGSFVLKTIRRFARQNGKDVGLLPKFKDLDDEMYGPRLFECAIANQDEYRALIDDCLVDSKWDPDRLAFMDIVILETAIAELLNFDSIPTLVTVNEYTDIANYYSTPKSGQFVTGMLYSIINKLKSEGRIAKD